MNIIKSRTMVAGIAVTAMFGFFQPVDGSAAESPFKGQTIRFVVGFGAGGGYDAYSRMLAPHFAKALDATVVVENLPGAGGMNALNRMYVAPADPVQLTIVNATATALQQLLEVKGARFDLTKFRNLGIIDYSRWIWLLAPNSPMNSVDDVFKSGKTLNWGGSGRIAGTSDGAAFTCATLKLSCKIVIGYKGSRESALALAQGEMDALYVSETSAYQYVQSKNAKPIATMARERSILFPDLPTIYDLVKLDKEQQWWVDYRNTLEGLGRILVAQPNTSQANVAFLREVTEKILTDPKIVEEANKTKRYIKFVKATEAEKMVERILNGVTPEQKKQIRKVVLEY